MSEQVSQPQLNAKLEEQVPKLSEKQKAKQEAQEKKYWNTMISRKEAFEMVDTFARNMEHKLQVLLVQNAALLDIIRDKNIATEEEITEYSQKAIERLFAPPVEEVQEEVSGDEQKQDN